MQYLLNIVDPVKCAEKIPWPLLDKKWESQFHTAVKMFLLEINRLPWTRLAVVRLTFLKPSNRQNTMMHLSYALIPAAWKFVLLA
jgi:hypothetical protein